MSEEVLLYLDNVDEYVNDENKIVTYKWLSRTLKIHVNLAKRLLFMFIQQERNKKDNDDLSVTYFVAGLHTDNNGIMKHSCFVVPETDLNGVRSSLSPVTSCHIYSVHKVKLKDSNALYTTDFEKIKENIFDTSSYSSIKYKKAKPQSKEELNKQSQVSAKQDPPSIPEKAKQIMPVSNNASSVNNKKKTDGKNSIASMFSQQSKPLKKEVLEKTEPEKKEEMKKTVNNKESQKKEGVKSFFKTNDKHSPTPPTTVNKIDEKVDINKNKKSPEKTSSAKRKGKQSDSDDRKKTSKRRRIKSEVFDSSSEDEMAVLSPEEEEENPFPVKTEGEPEIIIPPTPSPPKNNTPICNHSESGGRKRKRIKKLVTKTYRDEDGFMLTEKVYETDSTDASDSDKEDPIPKNMRANMSETEHSKQTTQKKKSPPKKASPVKGKQTSLTSFFKKK